MMVKTVAQFHVNKRGRYELFSLWVWNGDNRGCEEYDVEMSKRFGYIYHMSGAGFSYPVDVDGVYWASQDGLVTEKPCTLIGRDSRKRNKTRRLKTLPTHLRESKGDILDWLGLNALNHDTVWCSVCSDRLPAYEPDLCYHVWWCEETGDWSTPDDRHDCKCEDCIRNLATLAA